MSRRNLIHNWKGMCSQGLALPFILFVLLWCFSLVQVMAAPPEPDGNTGDGRLMVAKQTDEPTLASTDPAKKPSDEYGNVTEDEASSGEGPQLADPIEPWNRAMYHFNDKLYFWVLKPVAEGYKYALPADVRTIFSNFYDNIKAPVRIVNNLLQGRLDYAGLELGRFLINSTVGAGGLRDCAKDCFQIRGRDADFGQTLGKYGVGMGFYIVWPFVGPSSPRDSVGWLADRVLTPTTYVNDEWISVGTVAFNVHETVNTTSFRIGDYETLKKAAIDPYVAIRDAYRQYREKVLTK